MLPWRVLSSAETTLIKYPEWDTLTGTSGFKYCLYYIHSFWDLWSDFIFLVVHDLICKMGIVTAFQSQVVSEDSLWYESAEATQIIVICCDLECFQKYLGRKAEQAKNMCVHLFNEVQIFWYTLKEHMLKFKTKFSLSNSICCLQLKYQPSTAWNLGSRVWGNI